uniref:Uncharacterized protein n=1 Tax=Peronospora matthiolae TaxID=2874970 RepID=A0AAV1U359_9STRA
MTRVDGGGCGGGQVSMANPVGVCLRDFSEKCARVCEACLAQLVERKTLNLVVVGSSPTVSMANPVGVCLRDFSEKCARVCEACLAQLVERKTLNLVVVGSSPTVGDYQ